MRSLPWLRSMNTGQQQNTIDGSNKGWKFMENKGKRQISVERVQDLEPYETLEIEVIEFENEDVITTSFGDTTGYSYPGTNP